MIHALRISIVLVSLALTGCLLNTNHARVTADYTATIKKVGIVSLIGTNPNISYLGTSALESRFPDAGLRDWQPGRLVYEVLTPRLSRSGYQISKLELTPALKAARSSDWRAPRGEDSVADEIYAAGAAAGLDLVIVVQEQVSEDFITDTNQKVRGYGIQRAFDTLPSAYSVVYLDAFDIRKKFSVARAEARLSEPLDESLWQPEFNTAKGVVLVKPQNQAALTAALEKVVRISVGVAAQEAGF